MKIDLKFNMKNYLKFSSILVVGALSIRVQYGGKGSPPSLGWVFPVAWGRGVVAELEILISRRNPSGTRPTPIVSAFGDTVWGDGAVLIISKNLRRQIF